MKHRYTKCRCGKAIRMGTGVFCTQCVRALRVQQAGQRLQVGSIAQAITAARAALLIEKAAQAQAAPAEIQAPAEVHSSNVIASLAADQLARAWGAKLRGDKCR